jgi:hypothetical protein
MKTKLLPLVVLFSATFLALTESRAATPPPVLDLQPTKNGFLKDASGKRTDVDVDAAKVESVDGGLAIRDGRAVTILYDPKNPIFGNGSFTWVMKCRLQDPMAPSAAPILVGRWEVGRWQTPQDLRVTAIGLVPEKGTLNLMVSPDGSAPSCVGMQSPPVTAGEWIQIVFRVEVGGFMGFTVFDEKGDLIFEETVKEIDVANLFEADSDFVIGAGPEVGMTLGRMRVWDKALSPDQIEKAVSEK